jgi:hypothetical protein
MNAFMPRTGPARALAFALATLALSACGGGSNVRNPPPPPAIKPAVPPPDYGYPSNYIDRPVSGDLRIPAATDIGLDANVGGSVFNDGTMTVWNPSRSETNSHVRIGGNYTQGGAATLVVHLGGPEASDLRIAGNAMLAGTLRIAMPCCGIGDMYNDSHYSLTPNILHADGGISGQFDQVLLPSVFLSGSVAYGAHDVTMQLTKASAASVAGASADAMTALGAGNLDAAIRHTNWGSTGLADSLAGHGLAHSLAALWRIRDAAQAARSFDSLSGQTYASSQAQLLAQLAAAPLRDIGERFAAPSTSGHWANDVANSATHTAGYDFALSPELMLGGSITLGNGQSTSAREGANAFGPSSGAQLYARWRNQSGSYVAGALGVGRQRLQTDRRIDLGDGDGHRAWSQRDLDMANLHLEAGRSLQLGGGRFTPYLALDAASLRGGAFSELGDTGFELLAQPTRMAQATAGIGTRYARDWRFGDRWLRLALDGGYDRSVASSNRMRTAFLGVPEAWFDIGLPERQDRGWIGLELSGGGERWSWRFDRFHDNGLAREDRWSFGVKRAF